MIELKKDAYPKKVLNQLYKMTPLQTSFHYNMLALIDGIQPRVLGLAGDSCTNTSSTVKLWFAAVLSLNYERPKIALTS